jgi:hypothetical protein
MFLIATEAAGCSFVDSEERRMGGVMVSEAHDRLTRAAAAAAFVGMAVLGMMVSANATPADAGAPSFLAVQDPACDWLGMRHPLCGGGAFESVPDDGIPGDNAAEGGIPAPAMVPNIDGSMSPPGTRGAI